MEEEEGLLGTLIFIAFMGTIAFLFKKYQWLFSIGIAIVLAPIMFATVIAAWFNIRK